MCDDTQRVYTLGRGVDIDSLSGEEKQLLEDSKAYLRDAIAILKEWTTRPGDEGDGWGE